MSNDTVQSAHVGTSRESSGWMWLPLSAAVIVLDQLTKLWIVHSFQVDQRLHVLPVLDITLWYNDGAAFSFLAQASGWQRWPCSMWLSTGMLELTV